MALLDIHPKRMKTSSHKGSNTNVHSSILAAKNQNQLRHASTSKQSEKSQKYAIKYYSAIKRNKSLINTTSWMTLQGIILNEKKQFQKITFCMTTLYSFEMMKFQKSWTDQWLPRVRDRAEVRQERGRCDYRRDTEGPQGVEQFRILTAGWVNASIQVVKIIYMLAHTFTYTHKHEYKYN